MSDFEKGLLFAYGATAASAITAVVIASVTEGIFCLDGPTGEILMALAILAIGVFFVCCAYRAGRSEVEASKDKPGAQEGATP